MINRDSINWAKCKGCGDIVISLTRHDYQSCSCGKIAVDGGFDYKKQVGDQKDFIQLDGKGHPKE